MSQRRAAVWFALFGVVVLQLSSAAHHFEHVAGYVEAACKTCVQLDRVDDAASGYTTAALHLPIVDHAASQPVSNLKTRAAVREFDARAPPSF